MKTTDLYKFITDNKIEYHWYDNNVIIFVPDYQIWRFIELLGSGIMEEEGIECRMKYKYFCFWMEQICNYFGIELNDIFKPE